ncbi:hypothetical protein JW964_09595 [candidate division KSB1 bacterium]|nr:hypothetical protein [candidate division KSB1 bacterium]
MNIRLKTSLIVLVTIILGIIAGILIERSILHERFRRKFMQSRVSDVFRSRMEQLISPDSTQQDTVKKILDKHSKRMGETDSLIHTRIQSNLDSLKNELKFVLREDQFKRVEEKVERLKKYRRKPPPMPEKDSEKNIGERPCPPPNSPDSSNQEK